MSEPLLFVYGTLGPRFHPAHDWQPDAVRGRLYDLGPHPVLIDLNRSDADWVEGHIRPTTLTELTDHLDPYEGVDENLFQRVLTPTRSGRHAWVYVYARALPQWARGPLPVWPGPSADLSTL